MYQPQASNPVAGAYLKGQARGMEAYERAICRDAGDGVAVSERDRNTMQYATASITSAASDRRESAATLLRQWVGSRKPTWSLSDRWHGFRILTVRGFPPPYSPKIQAAMAGCRIAFVGRRPDSGLNK